MAKQVRLFDQERRQLRGQIEDAEEENERLQRVLNAPKATVACQAQPFTRPQMVQTDLSYQYLESAESLKNQPKRREHLQQVKNASRFVEDEGVGRDFDVPLRQQEAYTVQLQLETLEQQHTKRPIVRQSIVSSGPGARASVSVGTGESQYIGRASVRGSVAAVSTDGQRRVTV